MPDPSTATETVHVPHSGTTQTIQVYGPYEVLYLWDLTREETVEADLDPEDTEQMESASGHSWFRVPNHPDDIAKGESATTLYDLNDFSADWGITRGSGHPYDGWDGYLSDSAFSACLVRYCDEDGGNLGNHDLSHVMFGRVSW